MLQHGALVSREFNKPCVVGIENVNGEYRYYTKGDDNNTYDPEYRTNDDIIGIRRFNIKYIGIPTLWLKELFS